MIIEDNSRVDELLQVIDDLNSTYVEIGILGDGGRYDKDGEITVLGVAVVNEYGFDIEVTEKMRAYLHSQGLHLSPKTKYIKIPERSFIRSSYDEKKEKIFDLESNLEDVLNLNMPVDTFYNMVGQYCVGIIQKYMRDNVKSPPKHPFTLSKNPDKTNPLIQTGKLIDSIEFQIKRGS